MYDFRWNDWNREHIGEHGVSPPEVRFLVNHAKRPWPEYIGDGKWRVWGQAESGRYLQVVYVMDPTDTVFVIHARDLNDSEKLRFRKRRR